MFFSFRWIAQLGILQESDVFSDLLGVNHENRNCIGSLLVPMSVNTSPAIALLQRVDCLQRYVFIHCNAVHYTIQRYICVLK